MSSASGRERPGFLVLAGSGSELETGVPYSVTVGAVDDYLGALPARELSRACRRRRRTTSPWRCRRRGGPARRGSTPSATARIARCGPCSAASPSAERLVLVFDDLHWADAETGELVAYLLRQPPEGTLVAVAYRPAQLGPVLSREIDEASAAGAASASSCER